MPVQAPDLDPLPEPSREIAVTISVPEEFMGKAMHEANARRGRIIELRRVDDRTVFHIALPESEFESLRQAIAAETDHHGKVDRVQE